MNTCCNNHAGEQNTRAYNDARFLLLCQNQTDSDKQMFELLIPKIALNADEFTFDTWMEQYLRLTSKKCCDQCIQNPVSSGGDNI